MSELNETIADFIELRRANANTLESAAGGKPNQFQRALIDDLRDEADRLEAALKRERVTIENSSAVGNAAKMREALQDVIDGFEKADLCDLACICESCSECSVLPLCKAIKKAKAALAAPPRNCDRHGGDAKKLDDEWWEWSGDPRNCNDDGTVKLSFGEWLLEKPKGETDGND